MRKQIILSPGQSAAFAMGRVLIEIDSWQHLHGTPVDLERAIIIDFAVQHPRSVVSLVPEVKLVLEANQLDKSDFGDLFAHKHFGGIRERFIATLNNLVARGLVVQTIAEESFLLAVTEKGVEIINHLSTAYSLMLRELASVFCNAWKRKPISDLVSEVRTVIPKDVDAMMALGEPFGEWMAGNVK